VSPPRGDGGRSSVPLGDDGADPAGRPAPGSRSGNLLVRYFASAREAAGESCQTVPAGQALAATLATLSASRPGLAAGVAGATFLVDGARRDLDDARPLAAGSTLDVLPPFAGG